MKKAIFNLLLSTVIILSLASCEGLTSVERIIENNSSSEINVVVIFDEIDTLNSYIEMGGSELIRITEQLGGQPTASSPGNTISSLLIINESGDTLRKDYTVDENWLIEIEERSRIPSTYYHAYTFQVTDDDF